MDLGWDSRPSRGRFFLEISQRNLGACARKLRRIRAGWGDEARHVAKSDRLPGRGIAEMIRWVPRPPRPRRTQLGERLPAEAHGLRQGLGPWKAPKLTILVEDCEGQLAHRAVGRLRVGNGLEQLHGRELVRISSRGLAARRFRAGPPVSAIPCSSA